MQATSPSQEKFHFCLILKMVSVIVICYNQEKTIAHALDSVLRQDKSIDYEIVIGDDASTDSTREICRQYAEQFPEIIRLLPEEPNLGLVGNYFRCLKACRGEYISDCAGDDEWLGTTRLSDAMKIFESYPEVNAVYTDYLIFDTSSGESQQAYGSNRLKQIFKGKDILIRTLNRINSLPYVLSTAVYRKKDLNDVMKDAHEMVCNDAFGCEDVPIIAALASKGDAAFNPAITLKYNIVGESISNNTDKLKSSRFYLKSLRMSRILSKYYRIPESEMSDTFRTKSLYLASAAFDINDKDLARDVEQEIYSWSLSPSIKVRLYINLIKLPLLHHIACFFKRALRQKGCFGQ